MNEIQRIEMIKVGKALLDGGFFTAEEFAYLKKSIICDNPKSYEATFGDVQKAKELFEKKGLSQDEFDAIKTDFLLGKTVVNVEVLSDYVDLYDNKLIELDELNYLKACVFSKWTTFSGTPVLKALKNAFSNKSISEDEYNALRIATIYGENTPSANSINNLSDYHDLLQTKIITDSDYDTIKKVVLADGAIGSPDSFKGLFEYKRLLDKGAINQNEYDAKKQELMPGQMVSKYTFPKYEKIKEASTVLGSKDERYEKAVKKIESGSSKSIEEAIEELELLGNWKDSKDLVQRSREKLPSVIAEEEKEKEEKRSKIKKKIIIIAIIAFLCAIGVTIVVSMIHSKQQEEAYSNAVALYKTGEYEQAKGIFDGLSDYKNSPDWSKKCADEIEKEQKAAELYEYAVEELEEGGFGDAAIDFERLGDYRDSAKLLEKAQKYEAAESRLDDFCETDKGDVAKLREDLNLIKDNISSMYYDKYNDKLIRYEWQGTYEFESGDIEALSGNDKEKVKSFTLDYFYDKEQYRIIYDDGDIHGVVFLGEIGKPSELGSDIAETYFEDTNLEENIYFYRYKDNGNLLIKCSGFSESNPDITIEAIYKKVSNKVEKDE